MENKAHALAAGIFVAALTALVLALAGWLTRDTGVRDTYEISTKEAVTGLQEQAPVRFRGVDVGKVSHVGFDPKVIGNVLVRMEIGREAPITRDTFATLSFQGVTGLAFVQLADEGKPAPRLQPNEEAPPRIPLRPGLLARLEERGDILMDRVEEVTVRVNQVLGDDNQKRIAAALENIAQAAGNTNQLALRLDGTVRQRLDPALVQLTATMGNVQKAADSVSGAAGDISAVARRINAEGGPLDRVGEGTDALAQAVETVSASTLPRLNRVAEQTTRTMKSLDRAINELTENPQMLIYGGGAVRPGPGEPGFQAGGSR